MPDPLVDALAASRERTFAIVAHLDDAELERQIDPIMSPLVWDLGPHRGLRGPLARAPLRRRAAAAPRARRALRRLRDAARGARRDRAARRRRRARVPRRGPRAHAGRASTPAASTRWCTRWSSATSSSTPRRCARRCASAACWPAGEPGAADLQRRRAVASGSTSPPARSRSAPPTASSPTTTSARATRVELGAFRIARRPVTNATWLHFTEGGGYQRREWWSDEGWAWKEDYDIAHCPDAEAGHPDAPVCHVSWFEADAFARSRGARLPTEAEWEKAATWTQGDLEGIGQVWEWTASLVRRLPRLRRPPVPRVLRGLLRRRATACCAAARGRRDPRVATPTFRNWDLPQRRQIFAGVRLATDPRRADGARC